MGESLSSCSSLDLFLDEPSGFDADDLLILVLFGHSFAACFSSICTFHTPSCGDGERDEVLANWP